MAKRRKSTPQRAVGGEPSNWAIVSDTHAGCQLGLCPVDGARLDEGGRYKPNKIQRKMWVYWEEFWAWVMDVCEGEPFGIIHGGDALDGVHHSAVHQITHNLASQASIAYEVLAPVVELADGYYYHIRGTEAHVGPSGQEEERLAEKLGAIPSDEGQHARFELWKEVSGPYASAILHDMHHIGTTSSSAYEATAVYKELVESFVEAARWGDRAPDWIIRHHRHRFLRTEIAVEEDRARPGRANAVVTPGWQAKTPFAWKIAGARQSRPQFGGVVIRADKDEVYIRHKVWTVGRGRVE